MAPHRCARLGLLAVLGFLAPASADLNLLHTIPLNNPLHGSEPWGVVADPAGSQVFAACLYGPWHLIVLDPAAGSAITGAPLSGAYPHGIEVSSSGDRVYVACSGGAVSIVDAHTLQELMVVPLAGAPMDLCLRPTAGGDIPKLYVVDMDGARVWVLDAQTGQVLGTIPVGYYPYDVCHVASTDRVYVANLSDGTVSVIDATADTVMATVPVGGYPEGIAADPGLNRIYTANRGDNTVSVIDGATHTVIATYPVGASPTHLAVDPRTHLIYVVNTDDRTVSVIDPAGPVPVAAPVGLHPRGGICVHTGLEKVIVTNHLSNDFTVFNTSPPWNAVTVRLRVEPGSVALAKPFVPGSAHVHSVAVANRCGNNVMHLDPWQPPSARDYDTGYMVSDVAARRSDGLIAATAQLDDALVLYDGDTAAPRDTIAVGRAPVCVALRTDRDVAYTGSREDMSVSVVDLDGGVVVDTIALDVWPMDMVVNEATDRLYVTAWMGRLYVIDGTTHEILATIVIPTICELNQVALDETRDLIYVTALNGSALWVIDGASHQLLQELTLPDLPLGVAVNETLQRAYVCAGTLLIAIGPQHTITEMLPLPVDCALFAAGDRGTRRLYVSCVAPGGGELLVILDGNPSAVTGASGPVPARDGGERVRLRLASPNPVSVHEILGGHQGSVRLYVLVAGGATPSVRLYDAGGRLVRVMLDAAVGGLPSEPGRWELEWDCTSAVGRPTPSGVYFVVANAAPEAGESAGAACLRLVLVE